MKLHEAYRHLKMFRDSRSSQEQTKPWESSNFLTFLSEDSARLPRSTQKDPLTWIYEVQWVQCQRLLRPLKNEILPLPTVPLLRNALEMTCWVYWKCLESLAMHWLVMTGVASWFGTWLVYFQKPFHGPWPARVRSGVVVLFPERTLRHCHVF